MHLELFQNVWCNHCITSTSYGILQSWLNVCVITIVLHAIYFKKCVSKKNGHIYRSRIHQNFKSYINFFYFSQLIEGKLNADLECVSVLEKLLTVSKENPSFTLEHVFIETGTILIGVSNSINFNESICNRFSFYYF